MSQEIFNTRLSPASYGLISVWAKNIGFNPKSENIQISSYFSDIVNESSTNLSDIANHFSTVEPSFKPIDEELLDDPILDFIYNLIRCDMLFTFMIESHNTINPFALLKLEAQAHDLIKNHILQMLVPDYEPSPKELNEMEVLRVLRSAKAYFFDHINLIRILSALELDETIEFIRMLNTIEETVLMENNAYLGSIEAYI